MTSQFEPRPSSDQNDQGEKKVPPPALNAGEELRQIFGPDYTYPWLFGLVVLGMCEPAARGGSGTLGFVLGGLLAVAVWAGLGWILMVPFTAIRRQGIPSIRQILLATTILGIISVFGGDLGQAFSHLVAS